MLQALPQSGVQVCTPPYFPSILLCLLLLPQYPLSPHPPPIFCQKVMVKIRPGNMAGQPLPWGVWGEGAGDRPTPRLILRSNVI